MENRVLGNVGTTLVLENDRVRVWEMDLEPGAKSAALHRHDLDYVIVQIEGTASPLFRNPTPPAKHTPVH